MILVSHENQMEWPVRWPEGPEGPNIPLVVRLIERNGQPFRPHEDFGGIDSRAEGPWLGERLALWVLGPQIMAEPTGWPRERCMRSHQEFRAFRKASRPGQPAAIGTASPGTPKQWHIHVASNGKAVPSSHYCDQSGRRRSAQARFHRDKLEGADRTGRGQKARSASTYFFAIHFRSTHNPHRVHLGGNGRLHYAIDWVAGSGAKRMAP